MDAPLLDDEGSSPLARGLHPQHHIHVLGIGIIPARAGFTGEGCGATIEDPDHPRSRGVYDMPPLLSLPPVGSSPLARGLLSLLQFRRESDGIIPARAGFTENLASLRAQVEDHPRSRGVYAAAAWEQTKAAGSSPLARGLPRDRQPRGGPRRIIPARAGFTSSSTSSSTSSRDHPRSRGVYASSSSTSEGEEGSSPLARGLRSNDDSAGGEGGIIPARAGFTPPWNRPQCSSAGSSPLARGLLRALRNPRVKGGIIPARAGFTSPVVCHGE